MGRSSPRIASAGQRESGTLCAHCGQEIHLGDPVAVCRDCGAVNDQSCWERADGCGAYECREPAAAHAAAARAITITRDELAAAELPPPAPSWKSAPDPPPPPPRWNRAAIWAFIIALLGVPLFGIVTGLIAVVLGCIALVLHAPRRRGAALAVMAVVLGVFDVIGWAIGLSYYMGGNMGVVSLAELAMDPDSLKELPERLSRAMRANVLIQSDFGLGRAGIGSGVILKMHDGSAYIVTNRHVVDGSYHDNAPPVDVKSLAPLNVTTVGQATVPASVEWIAPNGVDLAIISAPMTLDDGEAREARWNAAAAPHIGDPVFAVGNPEGLGWTHSAGSVSQFRRRTAGAYTYRVLQSTAAINPGSSGGGLYNNDGELIGINTLTSDKRIAEGLSFSIALPALLELAPDRFDLQDANVKDDEK
jgi:hypothetical protein